VGRNNARDSGKMVGLMIESAAQFKNKVVMLMALRCYANEANIVHICNRFETATHHCLILELLECNLKGLCKTPGQSFRNSQRF